MDKKKGALGKGLGDLLPGSQNLGAPTEAAKPEVSDRPPGALYAFQETVRLVGTVTQVDPERISTNPYQPRSEFDETALRELSASIAELGIIQPLTVRAKGGGEFELISGERRLRAAKMARLDKVPAYVVEADTEAMLEMALVENIQREDLNAMEVAFGYQRLIDECDLTQEMVGHKVGKNRTTVTNYLRLLKLPPRVQSAVRSNEISAGHARALVGLEDKSAQHLMLQRILREGLSVREVEKLARDGSPAKKSKPKAQAEVVDSNDVETLQLKAFEDKLRFHFSTRVFIKPREDGAGRIEIEYYNNEDLERILEIIDPKS